MGTPKWKGVAGLAQTADASSTASPQVYPIAESVNSEGTPVSYERVTSQQPDILHIERSGIDYTWTIDGMQGNAFDIGYMMWLALGADSFLTDTHTITPADDSQYFNLKIDRKLNVPTNPTEECLGCRVGSFSFEQPVRDYAKASISGLFADLGTHSSSLTASIPTGTDNQPLGWAHLQDASGFFKIGYGGAATSADSDMQGWKFELTRDQAYAGIDLGNTQPDAINEGGRELTFEVTREFTGARAQSDYDAWINSKLIEIDVRYQIGANFIQFSIPQGHVVGTYAQEIGSGNESIMGTLSCKAFKGTSPLMTVTTKDGSTAAYT